MLHWHVNPINKQLLWGVSVGVSVKDVWIIIQLFRIQNERVAQKNKNKLQTFEMWCPQYDHTSFCSFLMRVQYYSKVWGLLSLFFMFLKQDSYAHQGWFYLIKNTVNTEEFLNHNY